MKSDMEWGPWIEYGVAVYDRESAAWDVELGPQDDWLTFSRTEEAQLWIDQLVARGHAVYEDVRVVERETSRWRFSESG